MALQNNKNKQLNEFQEDALNKQEIELQKEHSRTEIINFLLTKTRDRKYLEIGTRNPEDNFFKIDAVFKKSVDPCLEFHTEQIDFKVTSDQFFEQYESNQTLKDIKWDVIFIDGLHLAEQVYKDIINSFNILSDDGFIVLHDCNPPSEYHARENMIDMSTVATGYWNGTVWKAFIKARSLKGVYSACVDTDWGVGILCLTQKKHFSHLKENDFKNEFFEFRTFQRDREKVLNLITFNHLKEI